MKTVLITLILPMILTLLFLYIRKDGAARKYWLATSPFLIAAGIVYALLDSVQLYCNSPRAAAGIESWAILAAVASTALICFPKGSNRFRVLQGVFTYLAAIFLLTMGLWKS